MKNTGLILWSGLLSIFLFMTSCERSEGEGGKATIEGFVYKIVDEGTVAVTKTLVPDRNGIDSIARSYSFVADTIPAVKEDVFIIYGDDDFYGDDIETDFNGKYQFKYLVDGNYTVFAYNNLKDKLLTPEFRSKKIGKTGVHKVEDIYISDGKNASLFAIVGQVKVIHNRKGKPRPRMDVSVFLKQKGNVGPAEDVETDDEGYFVIPRLIPGVYEVWIETEFEGFKDQISALKEEVIIDGSKRIVELPAMEMWLHDEKEE